MSASFNVIDTIQGRSYPTETVKVYLDEASVYELDKLNQKMSVEKDTKKYSALEKQADELVKQIEESALTFHLQGIPPAATQELYDRYDKQELSAEELHDQLLAACLQKVVRADGAIDERKFTIEQTADFRKFIPPTEMGRIAKTINQVVTNTAIFENTVNAGFLHKS